VPETLTVNGVAEYVKSSAGALIADVSAAVAPVPFTFTVTFTVLEPLGEVAVIDVAVGVPVTVPAVPPK
jgi:hypothetical protein